ncbi:MAG TPA: beta-propeller fold lactonase family protein [Myxococcota bacterium]|nr:beta-propeller fold lactonase family protein [Myxococcota bacterium]HRY92972.1 beta-propeller fold lactonase family protein [Myxococcota bacterium]HSA19919.1 beta-propeller fold lactonase family protein [Myxococcota bacterium]
MRRACLALLCLPLLGSPPARAGAVAEAIAKDRRVVEVRLPVNQTPFDLAVAADGQRVWVTQVWSHTLSEVRDNKVVRSAHVGQGPTGLGLSADGRLLFVALGVDGALAVVDTESFTVLRKVPVCGFPIGVEVASHGRFVAVTCQQQSSVALVSTSTWEVALVPVGAMPYFSALSPDGARLYTSSTGANVLTVTQIELDREPLGAKGFHAAKLADVEVGAYPVGVCVSADGARVYVANYNGASVSVVGARSLAVEQTLSVGAQPYWVAVHPKDGALLVTNFGATAIDVIGPGDRRTQVEVGQGLVMLRPTRDGRRLFTTSWNSGQLAIVE